MDVEGQLYAWILESAEGPGTNTPYILKVVKFLRGSNILWVFRDDTPNAHIVQGSTLCEVYLCKVFTKANMQIFCFFPFLCL